jgi:hypothetical protein
MGDVKATIFIGIKAKPIVTFNVLGVEIGFRDTATVLIDDATVQALSVNDHHHVNWLSPHGHIDERGLPAGEDADFIPALNQAVEREPTLFIRRTGKHRC